MVAEWFYETDGEEYGPVTAVQLKQSATNGKLKADHLIWKEGMQKKVPAKSVKGLFEGEAARQQSSVATATEAPPKPRQAPPPKKQDDDFVETEVVEEEIEVVETVEADEEEKPKKDRKKDREEEEEPDEPPEMLAEAPAIYREGHPKLDGPITGMLIVETTGLCFSFEEEEETEEVRISYAKIDNVLEPAKGDFPPAMKSKALKAKVAGKAGQLASGLLGKWMGGTAGDMTAKLGSSASKMAEGAGDLGKPPRNRLTIFAQLKKGRCKIYIDIGGDTRDEMNEEAKVIYKKIQSARDKFSNKASEAPAAQGNVNVLVVGGLGGPGAHPGGGHGGSGMAAAPPSAGKPFRVLASGKLAGPFSLTEIRNLLAAGKVGGADMIGVETWLPVSTLSGLLGGGKAAGGAGAATGGGKADEEEEADEEDEVESEVKDEDEEEEEESSSSNEGDSIPVDDEFNID